jgi:hypothetical protein
LDQSPCACKGFVVSRIARKPQRSRSISRSCLKPLRAGTRALSPTGGRRPAGCTASRRASDSPRRNGDTLPNRQRAQRADRPEQEDRDGDQERDGEAEGERGCVERAAQPALPESFDVLLGSRLRLRGPQIAVGYDATGRWLAGIPGRARFRPGVRRQLDMREVE